MEQACTLHNTWPKNIIRVQFSPMDKDQTTPTTVDYGGNTKQLSSHNNQNHSDKDETEKRHTILNSNHRTKKQPEGFKVRRFDIRTPPSSNHLSTAECIAWAVSAIEEKPQIYETMMKPLDLMVEKWHSFSKQNEKLKQKQQSSNNNDDDKNTHKRLKKE